MKVTYESHEGSDLKVVNMARVSFRKRKDSLDAKDERLIAYLAAHKHWTPFSHCGATLHVVAPVAIRSQLFKHKVGFTESEVSRRYVDDAPTFSVLSGTPEWRNRASDKKQGSGDIITGWQAKAITEEIYNILDACDSTYRHLINEYKLCPEQARLVLPLATDTEWYWTGSLPAWARMYGLRNAPDAQKETQEIAVQVGEIMKQCFPVSWEALTNAP